MDANNSSHSTGEQINQTGASQTQPHFHYAAAQQQPPPQAPAPNYYQEQPVPFYQSQRSSVITSRALSAGIFGLIIVGTGAMGANLHRVNDGAMTTGEAIKNSFAKGAAGGVAAASATAISATMTAGGLTGLAVTLAAATGVSYLLSK
jgi:hypothetical protein